MPHRWSWPSPATSTCRRWRARPPAGRPTPTRWLRWPPRTGSGPRCGGWAPRWAGRRTPSRDPARADPSDLLPGVGGGVLVGDDDAEGDLLVVGGRAGALVVGALLDLHLVVAGQVDGHALDLLELRGDVGLDPLGVEHGVGEEPREHDGDQQEDRRDDDAGHQAPARPARRRRRWPVRLLGPGLAVLRLAGPGGRLAGGRRRPPGLTVLRAGGPPAGGGPPPPPGGRPPRRAPPPPRGPGPPARPG